MTAAVLAIAVGTVLLVWLLRRTWDKTERRDTVIGSRLSPRPPAPKDTPCP